MRLESCAWSQDGKWIALSAADGEVTTYDATAPALEVPMHKTMIGHGKDKRVHQVCFDGSGTLLASASEDRTARVWDVLSGDCVLILEGHQRAVSCCAFEHNVANETNENMHRRAQVRPARRLLTGSLDGLILLWDIEVGAVLRAMQKHTAAIYCCQFSPNDSYIASGSFDRTIKLWLGETGEEVAAGTNSAAETLLSSPSSSSEVHRSTAAAARTTVRHGTYKPQDENSRENHHTDRMAVCAFTSQALYPQCNLAATGGLDTTIRIWDRTTMCVIYEVTEHNDSITAICFASSLVAHVVVEVKRVVNTKQIQGEFFGEKTKI